MYGAYKFVSAMKEAGLKLYLDVKYIALEYG
jgi:hypothetical protein